LRLVFLMLVEHLLLFLKVFLGFIIPDKPGWVVKAEARADFSKESVRSRGSVHVMSTEENQAFDDAKKRVVASICEDDSTSAAPTVVTGRL